MKLRPHSLALLAFSLLSVGASANFHFMQIEQVIGGVNGDTSAQAIQLRMRSNGQGVVNQASLWAADASGANRVLLLDISGNVTTNTAAGSRILLTTAAFNAAMSIGPAFAPDFTLLNAIPASYLTAGRLTFEADGGTVYWSFAWGGAAYTGSNAGTTNDSDGDFGPAFGSALPTSSRQGVLFSGAANALSTANSTDYALSANPATVTRNSGTSFTVVPEPGSVGLLAIGAAGLSGLIFARRRRS